MSSLACDACNAKLSSAAESFCLPCRSLQCSQCAQTDHRDHPRLSLEIIAQEVCARDPSHSAIFFCATCQSYFCYTCYKNEHQTEETNNHHLSKARLNNNDDSNTDAATPFLSIMSSTDQSNDNDTSAFEDIEFDSVQERRPSDHSIPKSTFHDLLPRRPSLLPFEPETSVQIEDRDPILLFEANERLTIDDETDFNQQLCSTLPDPSVKSVSIIGNTGDGKSYTLNQLFFDGHEKFRTSHTSDSCTMGVWAALDDSGRTLVLDTEGRLGLSQNDNVRNRLLLKILCISDIIIFRTRAPKLPNDMFQFLSDASNAFLKYFRRELENVMKTCQVDGPMSTMGPTLIVFHETQHTEILKDSLEGHKTAVEQLKERFEKMNLTYDAYSLIEYVGTRTPIGKSSDFSALKAVVSDALANNKIRSPRRLSVIFRALKALNEKFNHAIPPEIPSSLPDEYFTCCVKCLACGAKCSMVANHENDGLPHHTVDRCTVNPTLSNEIYKCRLCRNEGKDTIVYGKLTNKCDDLMQGLLKYVWSGSVIECPHHGEIYRSRKYWYGNTDPKDVTDVEAVHVWPGNRTDRLGADVTARKVIDVIQNAGNYITAPTKRFSELVADQVAPSYWVPNKDATKCFDCELEFGIQYSKHHCRACGQVFCDSCTSHRAVVPLLESNTAERVCNQCYRELQSHLLSPIYQTDPPRKVIDDSLMIDDEASANAMTNAPIHSIPKSRRLLELVTDNVGTFVYKYPLHLIKEGTRPQYWQPDEECHACWVCERPFNTTTRRLHHCRQCGRGVCDSCSPTRRPVPDRDWLTPERVCQKCVHSQQ